MAHNNFRKRLLNAELLIGTFQKTPSAMIAEVLSQTDLDAVCIDAEHSPFDRKDIDASVLAYRAAQMPSLVRVPTSSTEHILNALDCGATGVVIPHIDTPSKASQCALSAHYGDGGRGYAGSTRAANYGSNAIANNIENNQTETIVIAQIEDISALDYVDEIASVEGIDCLFIGTMDLTVALGAQSSKDKRVIQACETICDAAQQHDRRTGIFVSDLNDIAYWRNRGVTLFLLGSEHIFIKQGVSDLISKTKNSLPKD